MRLGKLIGELTSFQDPNRPVSSCFSHSADLSGFHEKLNPINHHVHLADLIRRSLTTHLLITIVS